MRRALDGTGIALNETQGSATPGASAQRLIGRDRELELLVGLLAEGRSASRVLVILGDAGFGKTALLTAATAEAIASGARVLSATGVEGESELAFAGLHQLLRPLLADIELLPPRQRGALNCAFGVGEEAIPERFLIGLAVLNLLAETAEKQPVVVVIDDAPWIDHGSLEAIAFAARRLQAEAITVLVASRSEEPILIFGSDVPRMVVQPLSDRDARVLLDSQMPVLPPGLKARLLAEAAGIPLALIELPAALPAGRLADLQDPSMSLAPTARLERIFARRLADLSVQVRRILVLSSAADGEDLRPVIEAAKAIGIPLTSFADAEQAGFVRQAGDSFRFVHPLVRSVIYHSATYSERRQAHLALAEALQADPDRSAWHHAAVALEPDETIAAALEATAQRAGSRAGYASAARALQRAAALSPERDEHARRLTMAAEMAFAAGRADLVTDLVAELEGLSTDPHLRARAALVVAQVEVLSGKAEVSKALSIPAIHALMATEPAIALGLLAVAAGYSFLAGDRALAKAAEEMINGVPGTGDEPWRLYVLAATNPVENAKIVMPHIERMLTDPPSDPDLLRIVSHIPWYLDRPSAAADLLGRSIEATRTLGGVGGLASYIVPLALTDLWRGRWQDAGASAAEGIRIALESGQPAMEAVGSAVAALSAALQGQRGAVHATAEATIRTAHTGLATAIATWARGLDALAHGEHESARTHFAHVFELGDPAAHSEVARWAIADFVESIEAAQRDERVETMVADVEHQAEVGGSARAMMVARRARALLSHDAGADAHFHAATEVDGAAALPFELARTQLSHGEWLRRHKQVAASRPLLRAASDAFGQLGARPWEERSRIELRAAGVRTEARPPRAIDELTPQQRQIAQFAARGLTNREIGDRMFLSPKTIAFHLYSVFPKLQITTRSQLAAAMGEHDEAADR